MQCHFVFGRNSDALIYNALRPVQITRLRPSCSRDMSLQHIQHLTRVLLRLHSTERLYYYTVLIDQIRRPDQALALFTIFPRFQHIIRPDHFQLFIRQQRERQTVCLFKALVGGNAVLAHAKHVRAFFTDLRIQVTKPARLAGASAGHVLRVKVKDDLLALVIG